MEYTINSTVFGDWRITEKIGEGSYGTVYKIQKTDYGITTYSALKVIRIPRSNADIKAALNEGMDEQSVTTYFQGFVEEIVQEISVMASLKSHPNIVSYEDHRVLNHSDEIGWDILIRMELLISLQDYIFTHNLDEYDILTLTENLCNALAFCQKKGLIHRDIKPENIFVTENGQFKLGDFGVARTIEKTTGGLSKKGTESYMAPEVYLNKPYGSSVDIYSLGLVIYKFMNDNRLPFLPPLPQPITFADRENALSRRMKGETLPAPANACKEFSDIILKACAYKPEERYRTAADMLADIRNFKPHCPKTAAVIPDTPKVPPSSEETKGIFETVSSEETIGLWNIAIPQNEAEDEQLNSVCEEPAPIEENIDVELQGNDTLPEESPSGLEQPTDLELPADSEPSTDLESPANSELSADLPQPEKSTSKKKWLIGAAAVLIIGGCIGGMKINEHMKAVRHEQQVQESIEAKESFFEAVENMDAENAIEQYKTALESYPADERSYIGLSEAYIENKDYENAYAILQQGITACPDSANIKDKAEQVKVEMISVEITALIDSGNYEQASQKCEEALSMASLNTNCSNLYRSLIQCYLIQGKADEALEFLEKDDGVSLNNVLKEELILSCHCQKMYTLSLNGDAVGLAHYCNDNFNTIKENLTSGHFFYLYETGKYIHTNNLNSIPYPINALSIQVSHIDMPSPLSGEKAPWIRSYLGTFDESNNFSRTEGIGKGHSFDYYENGDYLYTDGEWSYPSADSAQFQGIDQYGNILK